jgi:hypothetical protein
MLILVLLSLTPLFASLFAILYLLTIEGHMKWRRTMKVVAAARSLAPVDPNAGGESSRIG